MLNMAPGKGLYGLHQKWFSSSPVGDDLIGARPWCSRLTGYVVLKRDGSSLGSRPGIALEAPVADFRFNLALKGVFRSTATAAEKILRSSANIQRSQALFLIHKAICAVKHLIQGFAIIPFGSADAKTHAKVFELTGIIPIFETLVYAL